MKSLWQWVKQWEQQSLGVQSGLIAAGFWLVAGVGWLLNPRSGAKFLGLAIAPPPPSSSLSAHWDLASYGALALQSQCSAFYPLWPRVIELLFHPTTLEGAIADFRLLATLLFWVSIPLALQVFRGFLGDRTLAFAITLLYYLSPLAIFRVIGYTEGLFGLLSLGLFWFLIPRSRSPFSSQVWDIIQAFGLFTLSGLLSLTRPMVLQTLGSAVFTLITLKILSFLQGLEFSSSSIQLSSSIQSVNSGNSSNASNLKPRPISSRNSFHSSQKSPQSDGLSPGMITGVLILGAIVGYSLYGWQCWQQTGNFWDPFAQQANWNKSLGFRPWLLLSSRSPLVDLWALYSPALVATLAVGQLLSQAQAPPLRLWGGLGTLILAAYPPLWTIVQLWGNRGWIPQVSRWLTSLKLQDLLAAKSPDLSPDLSPDIYQNTSPGSPSGLSQEALPLPSLAPDAPPPSPTLLHHYGFWLALYLAGSNTAIALLTQDRLVSLGRYVFGQPFFFLALGAIAPCYGSKTQRWIFWSLLGVSAIALLEQWVRYGHHQWLG